jgi:conjugative transfer signal peptidase TraF
MKYLSSKVSASRLFPMTWSIVGLSLLAGSVAVQNAPPLLVWNGSASAPLGLYRQASGDVRVDDWVLVKLPSKIEQIVVARTYLPPGIPLIKQVRATVGQTVCRRGPNILIDGIKAARAKQRDKQGRPLPIWSGCHTLGQGDYFLLQPHPDSFDGRYFGVVTRNQIVEKLMPVWTWNAS